MRLPRLVSRSITRSAGFIEHTVWYGCLVRLRFDRDAAQGFAAADLAQRRGCAGREINQVELCRRSMLRCADPCERRVVQVGDVEVGIVDAGHAQTSDRVQPAGIR